MCIFINIGAAPQQRNPKRKALMAGIPRCIFDDVLFLRFASHEKREEREEDYIPATQPWIIIPKPELSSNRTIRTRVADLIDAAVLGFAKRLRSVRRWR